MPPIVGPGGQCHNVLYPSSLKTVIGDFRLDREMRYSVFVPRFYNLCKSLGFEAGKIMPSCAFCSDESQGFPTTLIAKHFGTFPLNHGMVGGIVVTDLHGPNAEHGKDLVIIQASHVGYDPDTRSIWKTPSSKWAGKRKSGFSFEGCNEG